jgi:hypothetical protein
MNEQHTDKVEMDESRRRSRSIMDQLSVGERFMLMLGRGEVKHDPLRVEWKSEAEREPTAYNSTSHTRYP